MIHRQRRLRLPLMNHLVQQGVPERGPAVAAEVPAAERDFQCGAAVPLHPQFAEAAPHPSRQPDGNGCQPALKVLPVERGMKIGEPGQDRLVVRSGPFRAAHQRPVRGSVLFDRKGQQGLLVAQAIRTPRAALEKAGDRIEHRVRSVGVAFVKPQYPGRGEAHHHGAIAMQGNPRNVTQAAGVEPRQQLGRGSRGCRRVRTERELELSRIRQRDGQRR